MLKRLNPSIQLPKLDVVTINELSGEPDSFGFIGTSQINALLNVAVWSNDVGSVSSIKLPANAKQNASSRVSFWTAIGND